MCLGPCPSCLRMFGFGLCVLGWESGSWLVGNNMGRSSAIWVMGSGWVRPFTKPILVTIGPWAAMSLVYLWAGVFFRFQDMFRDFEFLRVFFVST